MLVVIIFIFRKEIGVEFLWVWWGVGKEGFEEGGVERLWDRDLWFWEFSRVRGGV